MRRKRPHRMHFDAILPLLLNRFFTLFSSFLADNGGTIGRFLHLKLRVERLTGIKPTLGGCSGKAEGYCASSFCCCGTKA